MRRRDGIIIKIIKIKKKYKKFKKIFTLKFV